MGLRLIRGRALARLRICQRASLQIAWSSSRRGVSSIWPGAPQRLAPAGLSRALITPAFRILYAGILCVGLVACVGAVPGQIPTAGAGSVRLASSTPPAGEPGQFVFTGAVTGTSQASQEACISSGNSFRSFTLITEGNVSGRSYFLSIGVYPYRGPGAYDLQPLPGRPLDYISTPNPLIDEAPGGYPGFLNFMPKSGAGQRL
jgi:hypothetical protein